MSRPAGLDARRRSGAIAFGTSMLPFLKSGEEIRVEPAEPAAVRPGDILAVGSRNGMWVVHRVVKVIRKNGAVAFLMKGDNCFCFDTMAFPSRVVGRVVWAGKKDLSQGKWRRFGRLVAISSYAQGVAYHALAGSRWNRWRHALLENGSFFREDKMKNNLNSTGKRFPRRLDHIVWKRVEGRGVLLNPEEGSYFETNPVGLAVWKRFDGKTSLTRIAQEIASNFRIRLDRAFQDVTRFERELRKRKLSA